MKPLTAEWVEKAEDDFASVNRELRARKRPNLDGSCFHAQQCAEKYLKAILVESGVSFPRTHNLLDLMNLLAVSDPTWLLFQPDLRDLALFAVAIRYPGDSADRKKCTGRTSNVSQC